MQKQHVIGIASILCVGFVVYFLEEEPAGPIPLPSVVTENPSGTLFVDEGVLDFGVVSATSQYSLILPIQNLSKRQVKIESFSTSCGCTVLEEDHRGEQTVPSGSTVEIPLLIDLTRNEPPSLKPHPFSVVVTAHTLDEGSFEWTIRGEVVNPFSIPNEQVLLVDSTETLAELQATRIRVDISPELTDLSATANIANIAASLEMTPDPCVAWLSLKATGDVTGPAEAKETVLLQLNGRDPRGRSYTCVWPIKIKHHFDLSLDPDFAHFGAIAVGKPAIRTFRVYARSARRFGEITVRFEKTINVSVAVKIAGDQLSVELTPAMTGECEVTGVVTAKSLESGVPDLESPVRLRANAVPF